MSGKVPEKWIEIFRTWLKVRGKRLTQEREVIVTEIFSNYRVFEIEDVVARLSIGRRVSRATIFRTVKALEDAGMVHVLRRTSDCETYIRNV